MSCVRKKLALGLTASLLVLLVSCSSRGSADPDSSVRKTSQYYLYCLEPYEENSTKVFISSKSSPVVKAHVSAGKSAEVCLTHSDESPKGIRCMRREYRPPELHTWVCPMSESCFGGGTFTGVRQYPTKTCIDYSNQSVRTQEAIVQFHLNE